MKICKIKDAAELTNFQCGIPEMDDFIHGELAYSIEGRYCVPYALKQGEEIIAFYALSYDSLVFPNDYFEDFIHGYSSSGVPDIPSRYWPIFESKQQYPAMSISYFAVAAAYQHQHIGSALLEDIINRIRKKDDAGCQFVVVDALVTDRYSALAFYAKNGFTVCEDKKPYKDCVRMYKVLYPQAPED